VPPNYQPVLNPGLNGDWQPDWPYIRWCVSGTIGFYFASAVFVYSASFFNDVDTRKLQTHTFSNCVLGSILFKNIYYRIMVDTTYFPVGQLFAQMGLACLGWAFVNVVTLRRTDPFTSGNGSHSAFKKLLWMVPIVFMYSTINT
jgi:hypothetical protein